MAKENYIFYEGAKYLLSDYTTMAMKAADLSRSEGYVRKLVFRKKQGKSQPIEYLDIPELKLTLVKK